MFKTITKNIPITLGGRKYVCDLLLGMYASSKRPAIILVESRPSDMSPQAVWDGAPVTVASTNAPEEYIQHLDHSHFVAKDYSENEGLWDQLAALTDESGNPFFHRTTKAVTLGFTICRIYRLSQALYQAFQTLTSEKESSHG